MHTAHRCAYDICGIRGISDNANPVYALRRAETACWAADHACSSRRPAPSLDFPLSPARAHTAAAASSPSVHAQKSCACASPWPRPSSIDRQSSSLVASSHIALMNALRIAPAAAGLAMRLNSAAQTCMCCMVGLTQHSGAGRAQTYDSVLGGLTCSGTRRNRGAGFANLRASGGRTVSCRPSGECKFLKPCTAMTSGRGASCGQASNAAHSLRASAAESGTSCRQVCSADRQSAPLMGWPDAAPSNSTCAHRPAVQHGWHSKSSHPYRKTGSVCCNSTKLWGHGRHLLK